MKRNLLVSLIIVCLAGLVMAPGTAAGADPVETPIELICPALKLYVRPEDPSGPGVDDHRLPELVLVVQKTVETTPGGKRPRERIDEVPQCNVKRVLYGSYEGKTIRFKWPDERTFWYCGEGDFIVALTPSFYKEQPEYAAFYGVPAADERAEAALSQARLDYAALSSACIFVGKELSIGGQEGSDDDEGGESWNASTVEVVRVIHGGATLQPGAKVRVVDGGMIHITNYHRRPAPQLRIYFVSPSERAKGAKAVYQVYTHQPIDQEARVKEALQHLNQCVVFEKEKSGHKFKYREVVFGGTIAQAIDLLGASNDGAVSLFYRTLMHRRTAARPEVVAAIETEMLRMDPPDDKRAGFRRLKHLVDLLGDMERQDAPGDIETLIDKYLSRIDQGMPEPPKSELARYWESGYRRTDVNRSLTWLLLQCGENRSRQKFGERLVTLRAKVAGGWKHEVQIALDAIKMEDSQELATAVARMKDVRPVRSRAGLRHKESGGISLVLFSHDGKLLATAGHAGEIRLWNTADWSPAVVIQQDGSIAAIRFSPDDRFLYVAGGGAGLEVHARFDTHTGKRDKAYQGHYKGIGSMELSPDGKTMVTSSYYERIMYFWDTESGKILRTISVSLHGSNLFLTPDGKGILRPTYTSEGPYAKPKEWFFEPFRGEAGAKVSLPKGVDPWTWAACDDGSLYSVRPDPAGDPFSSADDDSQRKGYGKVTWGQWKEGRFQKLGNQDLPVAKPGRIAVSANGKLLAVGGSDVVWFLSLPQLAVVGKIAFPYHERHASRIESLMFSPDSKLLALGMGQQTPGIVRTDTFKRLLPFDGHVGGPPQVFFSADGKELYSYGDDNLVCTWDTATMKMVSRVEIPAGLKVMSVREPDGHYAVLFDAALEREAFTKYNEQTSPAQIFDARTGRIISKITLPMGRFRTRVHWLDDREALVADEAGFVRFNYHDGKVVGDLKIKDNFFLPNGMGELTEDRRSLFAISVESEGRATSPAPTIIDLATGKVTSRKAENPERVRVNNAGLVPGGEYFYLADPNIYIYDRQTLKQVSKKVLDGIDILGLSFTGDGRRYALVSGGRIFIEDLLKWYDPKTQSIIRIHDTLSGKTVLAFPASTRWVHIKFSPDGKRLAVVNDDGTIEIWALPAGS